MISHVMLFGGTTEGRELAEFMSERKIPVWVSVTTEYGATLLPTSDYIMTLTGGMDEEKMYAFFKEHSIRYVIDATHPYATEVTNNIRNACERMQNSYYRVVRIDDVIWKDGIVHPSKENEHGGREIYFHNIEEIVDYLKTHQGNIFLTTGSKDLQKFCDLPDYANRCTIRILDSGIMRQRCQDMGFPVSKIICERGPFTKEENITHFRRADADYVVTKDSGKIGGFHEKLEAAKICGCTTLIVKRPIEAGFTLEEMKRKIREWS